MSDKDELFQLMLGRTTTKAVERILAAGYRKMPEPVIEWGIGSKWGQHAKFSEEAARDYLKWSQEEYPQDHVRLVKRIAAGEPGPWEEVK